CAGALAALLLLTGVPEAVAQIATATVAGVVTDETRAALPGVVVTVRSAATGTTRAATTDQVGRYRIAALDPGTYEVRAELRGFRTAVRTGVALAVGGTADVDITMSLGSVSDAITVVGEVPLIEPSKAELSRVVTAKEIESLPISGRNFVDFVKL